MSEAKPDPSGSTGEFRAFVERGSAERERWGLSGRVLLIAAVAAVVIVIVVVAVVVR